MCWAGAVVLVWTYFRAARWLALVLLLLPLGTLLSRLYLGAHHLTDALTSVVYASVWLLVVAAVLLPRRTSYVLVARRPERMTSAGSGLVEHPAERDAELDRLAGVRVLGAAADETAVVAGEDDRLDAEAARRHRGWCGR